MVRHSQAVGEKWCSAILRETRDVTSLDAIGNRALNDPEVREDPALVSRIQSFIAERRAELRAREVETSRAEPASSSYVPAAGAARPVTGPSQDRLLLDRMLDRFRLALLHFDESDANAALAILRELLPKTPTPGKSVTLASLEDDHRRHARERQELLERIDREAGTAVSAAARGDHGAVAEALQQLVSLRAAYPALLSERRLEAVRQSILHASEHHEHRVAARELLERERALTAEIASMTEAIRHFHRIARSVPHNRREFLEAEARYRRVVDDVDAHDAEWYAGVVLEICDLLAAWGNPPPAAERNVEEFLERLRASLQRLRQQAHASQD